jgi:hypothetical protein
MLEHSLEWLSHLQASSADPESHLSAPSADAGPLRAVLLRADVNGHTPAWLGTEAKAPMKLYLMARLDPWSILWAHSSVCDTPLARAALELEKRSGKGKHSEVRHIANLTMRFRVHAACAAHSPTSVVWRCASVLGKSFAGSECLKNGACVPAQTPSRSSRKCWPLHGDPPCILTQHLLCISIGRAEYRKCSVRQRRLKLHRLLHRCYMALSLL